MPSFPKPKFPYRVDLDNEIAALRHYRDRKEGRGIPQSKRDNLLLATWNIANLGAHVRREPHLKIISEILSWFDLIAVQETKENIADFQAVVAGMGEGYRQVFSGPKGNGERMAFIYNRQKVSLKEEIAELSIPPSDQRHIKLPGIKASFSGFDRSPYMVSFQAGRFICTCLNVHLYFGSETDQTSIDRRCLEAYAVGRWADLRGRRKYAFSRNIFALGDFNLPKFDVGQGSLSDTLIFVDPVYRALLERGLQLPEHSSRIYSNIRNDRQYDQIAFVPGLKRRILSHGVFDYDGAVFADMFQQRTAEQFRSYLRYYISDHRPVWMEVDIRS